MALPLLSEKVTRDSATSPACQTASSMIRLPRDGRTLFCSRAMAPLQLVEEIYTGNATFQSWRLVSFTHTLPQGGDFTVLLKSDGTTVTFGEITEGHGTTVTCGEITEGICDIPALPDGVTYVQLACALSHIVLIRSDGNAVACGNNSSGCCNIPALIDGVAYTHVASIGSGHTVFLTSDGNAVACGMNLQGQCSIPALPPRVTYVHRGAQIVLTLFFCDSHATFCFLSGEEVCRFWVNASDTLMEIRKVFKCKTMTDYGKYRVVVPNGEFLGVACAQAPSTIIEPFLIRKRVRRI